MAIKQRLDLDTNGYRARLKAAQADLIQFSKKSETVGRDVGKAFERGARDAERAWQTSGGRIERTLTNIKRVVAAVFAAQAVRTFGGALIEANRQVEDLQIGFTTLLGSETAAAAKLREIQALAMKSPLGFPELAGAARTLLAFGTAADALVPRLEAISNAAAAVAPGQMQETIERIVRALGQMEAKGKVSAEEMLQLTEAGLPAWQLLAQATGKSTAELQKLSEQGLLPARAAVDGLIQSMTTGYGGAAQRMAGGLSGILGRIQDEIQSALRTSGGPLFDQIKTDLQSVLRSIEEMRQSGRLDEWAERFGEALAEAYRTVKSITAAIVEWGPMIARMGAFYAVFRTVGGAVEAVSDGYQRAVARAERLVAVEKERLETQRQILIEQQRRAQLDADFWGQEFTNHPAITQHAATKADWDALSMEKMRAADIQMMDLGASIADVDERMNQLGATGVSTMRKLGMSLRGALAAVFSWENVLTLLLSLLVSLGLQYVLFGRKVDEATQKLKDQREEMKRLVAEIHKLDGIGAAGRKMEIDLEIKINETMLEAARRRIAELEATIDAGGNRMPGNTYGMGGNAQNTAAVNERALLRARVRELEETLASQRGAQSAVEGVLEQSLLGQIRLLEIQIEKKKEAVELTENELARIRVLEEARQAALENPKYTAEQLKPILAEIDGQIRALNDAARGRMPAGEIAALEQRLKLLQEEAMLRGLMPKPGSGAETPTPVPASLKGLERELRQRQEMLEAAEELHQRLSEIHGIEREIADLEEKRAQATGALASDLEAVVSLLRSEADYQRELYVDAAKLSQAYQQMPQHVRDLVGGFDGLEKTAATLHEQLGEGAGEALERMLTTLVAMTPEAARLVDELGGLETFTRQGYDPEMVSAFLPDLNVLRSWSQTLTEELSRVQRDLDLKLITEEDARLQAEAAAEAFREKLLEKLQDLNVDTLPAPLRQLIQDLVGEMSGQIGASTTTDAEKLAQAYEKQAKALEAAADRMRSYVQAGRGLMQIASTLKIVGRATESLVSGLLDAADAFAQVRQAQAQIARQRAAGETVSKGMEMLALAPGYVGIAAGVVSGVKGMIDGINARRKEAREQAEAHRKKLQDISDSLRSYQQQMKESIEKLFTGGRTGSDLRQSQIASAKDALSALQAWLQGVDPKAGGSDRGGSGTGRGGTGRGYTPVIYDEADIAKAREFMAQLNELGLWDVDLVGLFETMMAESAANNRGGTGDLSAVLTQILMGQTRGGRPQEGGFEGLMAILAKLEGEFGDFTGDVEGAIDAVSFFARFLGTDVYGQFSQFLTMLLDSTSDLYKKLDSDLIALLEEAQGLDLTTAEGKARLKDIIGLVAGAFPEYMGDLTSTELERLLAELQRMYDEANQPAPGEDAAESEWTRSVQWLRTISEASAHEMVVLLTSIDYWLRRIYEASAVGYAPRIQYPSVPYLGAGAGLAGAAYSAQFGAVNINLASQRNLARTAGRELERQIQAKRLRPF